MQGEGQGEPPPVLSSTHCLTTAYQQQPQQSHLKILPYHPSTFPLPPNRGPSIPLPPPSPCLPFNPGVAGPHQLPQGDGLV